jgi:hypothetical protein
MTGSVLKRPSILTAALLMATTLTLWLWVLVGPSHLVLSNRRLLLLLGVPAVFAGVCCLAIWTFLRTPRCVDRLGALFGVLLLLPLGIWVQHHTDLGVFALGGSSFWIHRAAESPDAEAIQDLNLVLSATQYGVNAAEEAVLEVGTRQQRRRLFLLLAERAPTERWAARYRQLAEESR